MSARLMGATFPLRSHAHGHVFAETNRALDDLRGGRAPGGAALVIDG